MPLSGKRAVVVGRSLVVGKPAAMMLDRENATVTLCNSRTRDLPEVCREADIVVVAMGKAGAVGAEHLREGQVVVDVGIHVNEEGKLCGDVRFGVAQGSYMTRKNLQAAQKLLQPYLEEARNKQNVEDIYMLLTDVPKEESVVISDGRYASEVLADGFETQPAEDGSFTLPGVVSRKKQFIPALMTAYQEL